MFSIGQQIVIGKTRVSRTVVVGKPDCAGNIVCTNEPGAYVIAHEENYTATARLHVFGGVCFEETGEVRRAKAGEWVLSTSPPIVTPYYWYVDSGSEFQILRPVTTTQTQPTRGCQCNGPR